MVENGPLVPVGMSVRMTDISGVLLIQQDTDLQQYPYPSFW